MFSDKRFYINSDHGFYKDFVLGSFVNSKEEAYIFSTRKEAEAMIKALQEIDKIAGLEVIEEDLEMSKLIELAKKVVKEAEANAVENPKTDEIQIVVVEPEKKPYKKMIKNELRDMKKIVGGHIENIMIGQTEKGVQVGITLNKEAKSLQLPLNRRILNLDFVVGPFFITAYNLQGDNVSLSDKEAKFYIKRFTPIEVYL